MNKSPPTTLLNLQCRICLSFNPEDESASVNNIITLLTEYCHLSVLENDGLPTQICKQCLDRACRTFEFIKLCENSDGILRNALTNNDKLYMESLSDTEYILPTANIDELCIENINFEIFPFQNYDICDNVSNESNIQNKDTERDPKPEINNNTCPKCGKVFKSLSQLKKHIGVHKRKGSHLCQICGKQFTFPENLARHSRIHSGDKKYICKICSKAFIQSGELKTHMVSHTTEKIYLCSYCGSKFARKLSLKVHVRRIHSIKSEAFICHLCGKGFKDRRDLGQHKLIHTQESKHICSICDKAFNRKSNLLAHSQIHRNVKPHTCDLCVKGFTQKHGLNKHKLKIHNVTVATDT